MDIPGSGDALFPSPTCTMRIGPDAWWRGSAGGCNSGEPGLRLDPDRTVARSLASFNLVATTSSFTWVKSSVPVVCGAFTTWVVVRSTIGSSLRIIHQPAIPTPKAKVDHRMKRRLRRCSRCASKAGCREAHAASSKGCSRSANLRRACSSKALGALMMPRFVRCAGKACSVLASGWIVHGPRAISRCLR